MPGSSTGSLGHLQLTQNFQPMSKMAYRLHWKGDLLFTLCKMMKNWSTWVSPLGSTNFISTLSKWRRQSCARYYSRCFYICLLISPHKIKNRYWRSLSNLLRVIQLASIGIRIGTSVWIESLPSSLFVTWCSDGVKALNFWSRALELFPWTIQKLCSKVPRKCCFRFTTEILKVFPCLPIWVMTLAGSHAARRLCPVSTKGVVKSSLCRQALSNTWKYPQARLCLNKTEIEV